MFDFRGTCIEGKVNVIRLHINFTILEGLILLGGACFGGPARPGVNPTRPVQWCKSVRRLRHSTHFYRAERPSRLAGWCTARNQ